MTRSNWYVLPAALLFAVLWTLVFWVLDGSLSQRAVEDAVSATIGFAIGWNVCSMLGRSAD
jgi:hypothetical protein